MAGEPLNRGGSTYAGLSSGPKLHERTHHERAPQPAGAQRPADGARPPDAVRGADASRHAKSDAPSAPRPRRGAPEQTRARLIQTAAADLQRGALLGDRLQPDRQGGRLLHGHLLSALQGQARDLHRRLPRVGGRGVGQHRVAARRPAQTPGESIDRAVGRADRAPPPLARVPRQPARAGDLRRGAARADPLSAARDAGEDERGAQPARPGAPRRWSATPSTP